jgi:exonuclease III
VNPHKQICASFRECATLSFLLLLACYASTTAKASTALRVATFNVEWLTGSAHETRMAPWKTESELSAHRRKVAAILVALRPDIIALQEVTTREALEKLATEPALHKLGYRALHIESEDHGTGQDVVFLVGSRIRIDTIAGATIRRFADTLYGRPARILKKGRKAKKGSLHQRLTKHALVCISKPEKICLLGLHLLAHPDDPGRTAKRETQARIAAYIVRTEIVSKGYAPIVLGDINDFDPSVGGPSDLGKAKSRKVLSILKDIDPSRSGSELVNAASRVEPVSARYSAWWDKNRNNKRDSTDPLSLLDHILVDQALAQRIVKAEIRHDLHDGTVSDHWPVVVEINPEKR